jgi:Inhibitor of Apoptosis domain
MFTFSPRLTEKLLLDAVALAKVGFYWVPESNSMKCWFCGLAEPSIVKWQNVAPTTIRMLHYQCTGGERDSDIPVAGGGMVLYLNYEAHRKFTFYRKWNSEFTDIDQLAASGFFFTGEEDLCECHFCGLVVGGWKPGAIVDEIHEQKRPDCPLVRLRPVGNFVMGSELEDDDNFVYLYEIRPLSGPDDSVTTQRRVPKKDTSGLRSGPRPPVHSHMQDVEARFDSFVGWPSRQNPRDMAEAGFFYTGEGDSVLCFHCDGGLKEWVPEDEPAVLHAKWFGPYCAFLKATVGADFIASVRNARKPIMSVKDFRVALENSRKK